MDPSVAFRRARHESRQLQSSSPRERFRRVLAGTARVGWRRTTLAGLHAAHCRPRHGGVAQATRRAQAARPWSRRSRYRVRLLGRFPVAGLLVISVAPVTEHLAITPCELIDGSCRRALQLLLRVVHDIGVCNLVEFERRPGNRMILPRNTEKTTET